MPASGNERMIQAYDNTLLGILQNEAGLEPFIDVICGFLFRRTDFYRTMHSPTQKYGFPPGVAEKMIMKYFKKYQNIMLKAESEETSQSKSVKLDSIHDNNPAEQNEQKNDEDKKDQRLQKKSSIAGETQEKPKETLNNQAVFQNNPDSYNGAIRDKYSWSQNYDDVDIKIPVDKTVKKAKQVHVDIQKKRLKVTIGLNDAAETIIDDDLQHEINREESMWSLEPGKHIDITLTKDKNTWWSMLIMGEDEIDIQKICPERSMADMDQEEMAVINKLHFDDRQKKLGLPQSHELKVHEMLKKGWNAEGSPFQGQEFDPKMFNVSPGAGE